jgi:hypothetical protein
MVRSNLKQLVTEIRAALEEVDSERRSSGKPALFELETLELEIKFTVTESDTTKGGFDIKIITLGSEGNIRGEAIQGLRLSYRVATSAVGADLPGTRFHSSSSKGQTNRVDLVE